MNFSKRLNLFGDEIFAALNERRLELEKQGKKIYNMRSVHITRSASMWKSHRIW